MWRLAVIRVIVLVFRSEKQAVLNSVVGCPSWRGVVFACHSFNLFNAQLSSRLFLCKTQVSICYPGLLFVPLNSASLKALFKNKHFVLPTSVTEIPSLSMELRDLFLRPGEGSFMLTSVITSNLLPCADSVPIERSIKPTFSIHILSISTLFHNTCSTDIGSHHLLAFRRRE